MCFFFFLCSLHFLLTFIASGFPEHGNIGTASVSTSMHASLGIQGIERTTQFSSFARASGWNVVYPGHTTLIDTLRDGEFLYLPLVMLHKVSLPFSFSTQGILVCFFILLKGFLGGHFAV